MTMRDLDRNDWTILIAFALIGGGVWRLASPAVAAIVIGAALLLLAWPASSKGSSPGGEA